MITSLSQEVRIAQKAVDDTRIVAPFDGVVSQTFVDNFQNVIAKQPVIRFLDVSKIEMIINIPEAFINLSPYVRDLRVRFDAAGNVAGIDRAGMEKVARLDPDGKRTPTLGRDRSFFEDLFGNIGAVGAPGMGGGGAQGPGPNGS